MLESPKEHTNKDLKNTQSNISRKKTKQNSNEKKEKSQVEAFEKQLELICECIKDENKSETITMVKEYGEKMIQTIKNLEEKLKNLELTKQKTQSKK